MPPARQRIVWEPTSSGPGSGSPFFFFSGYESLSDADRLMRLRELPHIGDDIASLRAAGFSVVFEMQGTAALLADALAGRHPASVGRPAAGVVWNGHGVEGGALVAHDGALVHPDELDASLARVGACRLFVLGCCWAGAHAASWQRALGPQAHVFGWPMPVTVETGIDFYTADDCSEDDLDDLLLRHLGVRNLGPGRHEETRQLLALDHEHAQFYGANHLAPDPSTLSRGQHVLAQWKNGGYFPATLADYDGARFLAQWSDGDEPSWVQPYQLRPLGAPRAMRLPGVLRVGAHVRAPWTNGALFSATLVDWDGARYLARWDDGDTPTWVDPSAAIVDGSDGAPRATVGMHVRARWRSGKYFAATLVEQDGDRFLAAWADGDEPSWVDVADIQT